MTHLAYHYNEWTHFQNGSWLLLSAYLMGSVPWGWLIGKVFLGFDPRTKGSGNIGMTNLMRTGGKWAGIATFILDFGKGWVVLWALSSVFRAPEVVTLFGGFLVIFGHTRSVFLKFTGGKGVATNFGVWAALDPYVFFAIACVWIGLFLWKKISSLSALMSLVFLPAWVFLFNGYDDTLYLATFVSAYLIVLHKPNIVRLLDGQEKKLSSKAEPKT